LAQKLLKIYFGNEPYFNELMDCVVDITQRSMYGQILDCQTGSSSEDIQKSFTNNRYDAIVKYKTSYYTMYFPVAVAMIMAGKSSNKVTMKKLESILLAVGHYFQVQDDYLDCFGDEQETGKFGTDIQDNKCSWLVVQALELCNPEELQFLIENYGKNDINSVGNVKQLYRKLNLIQVYADYEMMTQNKIMAMIKELPEDVDEEVFRQLFLKIYQRKK